MKTKTHSVLTILILISYWSIAQTNSIIDSLKQQLLIETSSVKKCSIYNNLVRNYIHNSPKLSLQYNDSLSALSMKIKHEELHLLSMYNYSVVYRVLGDTPQALSILMDYKKAVEKKKDTGNLIPTYYQIGVSHMALDNKVKAVDYLLKSLELSELTNAKDRALINLNALGAIYDQMGQYEKALSYYKKVEASYLETGNLHDLGLIYNNIGIAYKNLDSLNLALNYFQKGYDISKDGNDLTVKSFQLRNIGLIKQSEQKYNEAEQNFIEALNIRKDIGEQLPLCGSYYDLGNLYLQLKNTEKAKFNLEKSLQISRNIKSANNEALSLIALSQVYEKLGNINKAYEFYKMGKVLNDSLQNNDLKEKVNKLDKQYQTVKKDKELAKQELEIKEKEVQIQKKRTQINYMIGVAGFLLVSSILLWFLLKQRQKRKNQEILALKREHQVKTLESLIEGEEKERLRLAKELHDGVNGDLSAIKYKLTSLLELNNNVIKEAISMIDDSCTQVRAISHNLVPPTLESFNLIEATDAFCQNMDELSEPKITFQFLGDTINLDKKVEVNIYRIIQELVNNSLKHANSTEINVQISFHNTQIQITVEDNGQGYNTTNSNVTGIGLKNIQSRIDYLKAEKDVVSNKNGTSYTIEIDINKLNED
ncbi:hypothetical protein PK35_15155 [Tamlana nanhaiensis]|uniref:histidine kinase n=1 Tax=Neotamlana nanhaiensis TaxID=1382798 RepID=A0A0D7W0S6_9FLAO|nr:sensor histidine kinase [Tamlana nanhaiensis]KJD31442.1 hypothetical protein PK35_15155 [Tamlana nanhaiensis]